MKNYYGDEDMKILGQWPWMPMFISLGLVLLTLFIFLTTFAEKDKIKIDIFKRSFRERLTLSKGNLGITGKNRENLELEMGTRAEPVLNIVKRMRSKGINKKLMDEFLTVAQVKNLEVIEGKKGVCVIIPGVVIFKEGKTDLLAESTQFLARISFLVSELPYLVEIKGCA
ncbi:MAG: hypothetical protein MUF15_25070, partial [Acidobacteria bacterium]|nr:hypothetical protein [Acidobacteriota bacterium]